VHLTGTIVSVTLDWTDNAGNETHFEVKRCLEAISGKGKNRVITCNFAPYATAGADVTTLSVGTEPEHRYRVRAVNAAGASAFSNEVKS
jgi:hypothetical protein